MLKPSWWQFCCFAFAFCVGLVLLGFSLGRCVGLAEADDQGDFLGALPTWVMKNVESRGYGLYVLDERASQYPNFRAHLWACYADLEAKTHIPWYEVGAAPPGVPTPSWDLAWTMPDTWQWGGGVAGVAFYGLAPAHIDLNWRLGYNDWGSTVCHEEGHIEGQEDLYLHPLTCDSSRKWTRMSCATFVKVLTSYDRDIVLNAYIPDIPSAANVTRDATWLWVNYNSVRQSSVGCVPFSGAAILGTSASEKDNVCGHFSPWLDNVTRVAVFTRDNGGAWAWTGFYGPPAPIGGWSARGYLLDDWCPSGVPREWGVHPESSLRATWPQFAGGVGFLSGDIRSAGFCP